MQLNESEEQVFQQQAALSVHAWEILRLGLPILVSMAALIGLGVTDTLMAGRASTSDVAALSVGSNLYFIAIMAIIGLQSIVAPRISWRLGLGRSDAVRSDCWQSMWLGLFAGTLTAGILFAFIPYLSILGLESEVLTVAKLYLGIVLLTLPLMGVNLAVRNMFDGLGYAHLNMWVSLLAFVLNLFLDYALVFGKFGFPAMGAAGCAIATVFVVLLQTVAPWLICRLHPMLRQYEVFKSFVRPNWATLKTLLWLGLPAALAVTLEESFFASTTILVAPMGTTSLATHQIVLIIAMVALIFPIAIGQAGAIVIGRSIGQQSYRRAQRQVRAFLLTVLFVMIVFSITTYYGRDLLMSLFTRDAEVIALGLVLLLIVVFQLVVDGLQIGSNIALKGYQDTLVPALFQVISYWCVGFPLAWLLTKTSVFGAPGGVSSVWLALFTGLSLSALLGVGRLLFVSREFASGRRQLADS